MMVLALPLHRGRRSSKLTKLGFELLEPVLGQGLYGVEGQPALLRGVQIAIKR